MDFNKGIIRVAKVDVDRLVDEGCLLASDLGEVGIGNNWLTGKREEWQEVKMGLEQFERYLDHRGLKYRLVASGAATAFILYHLLY